MFHLLLFFLVALRLYFVLKMLRRYYRVLVIVLRVINLITFFQQILATYLWLFGPLMTTTFLILGDSPVERAEFTFSCKLVENLLQGSLTTRVYFNGEVPTTLQTLHKCMHTANGRLILGFGRLELTKVPFQIY